MAEEYGFSYELVQYQWPRWLQRQRDRQRTIWGYKILFLDVLFPLHVKKIIFVDADQVIKKDIVKVTNINIFTLKCLSNKYKLIKYRKQM